MDKETLLQALDKSFNGESITDEEVSQLTILFMMLCPDYTKVDTEDNKDWLKANLIATINNGLKIRYGL